MFAFVGIIAIHPPLSPLFPNLLRLSMHIRSPTVRTLIYYTERAICFFLIFCLISFEKSAMLNKKKNTLSLWIISVNHLKFEKQLLCQSWSLFLILPIAPTLTGYILLICHPNVLSCNTAFLVILSSTTSRHQVTIMRVRVFTSNPNMVMLPRSSTTPNKHNRRNSRSARLVNDTSKTRTKRYARWSV